MKHIFLFSTLILYASLCEASSWFSLNQFTPDSVEIYKTVDGQDLELFIFYPDGILPAEPRPAMVLFHGGGFSSGSPTSYYYLCRYLASRGMVAISVQYRLDNDGVTAVMDGKSAMRYVRSNAASLGIDPALIAAGGGSAGGALAAALSTSTIINHADDDLSVSEKPQALVLFNPIYYTTAFPSYDQAIRDDFTPYDNISSAMAPTLVLFGEFDSFVNPPQMLQFQQAMRDVGVRSELFIYENRGHAWSDNDREAIFETLKETDLFLESEGFLDGLPTIEAWLAATNNDVGTQYPTLSVTTPQDGAVLSEWTNLAVSADASDPDAGSSISNVRIFLNGVQLRIDSSPPFAWGPGSGETDPQLLNLPAGVYTIDSEALDDDGMWAKDSVTITVVEAPLNPPAAPTGLNFLPADRVASLDWSDNLEGDVVSYNLYRRIAGESYGSPVQTGIETSAVIDTQVSVGDSFFYAVTAVDADGNESALSSEVEVAIASAQTANVPASSNAYVWKRGNNTIYSAKETLGLNRANWAGFAQAAFIRFDLSGSGEIGGIDVEDLTVAILELYATATDGGDTIRVFGLLDGAGVGVAETLSETSWTGGSDGTSAGGNNLHESNRPDGSDPVAPPNALTSIELGQLTFAPVENANVGLVRIEITELEAFKDFLRADTNGEITLILRASQDGDVSTIASLYNTSGFTVPTLAVVGGGGVPTPSAPVNLTATAGDAEVSLAWTAVGATDPITYAVYRTTTAGDYNDSAPLDTGLTTNSYIDNSAINGSIYYYRVTASNADADESGASEEVFAIPAAPGNQAPSFEFAAINAPGVDVGGIYSASIAAAASDPESDTLLFSKVSGPDWLTVSLGGNLSGTAPLVTGPNSFTVRVDAAGGSANATLEILVVPDDTPPPVPSGLSATAGDASVSLIWDAAGGDTASYKLYRSEIQGALGSLRATGLTDTSFLDEALTNGTTYYYVVTAVDASGNESALSSEVSAMPEFVPDSTPPAQPNGLSATAGDTSVTLDWDDNSDADFNSYRVYRSTTSGSFGSALVNDLSSSSYTDNNLANGTTYYYVVTAVDTSNNQSLESNEVTAVPAEATAAIIADYSFGGSSLDSFDSDSNSTASALTEGGGLNSDTINNALRGDPTPALIWTDGDYNDGTILDDDYLSFTVTLEAGVHLIFDQLSLTFKGVTSDVHIFSDQDGFATMAAVIATVTHTRNGSLALTADLSGMSAAAGPVEFRLYFDTASTFGKGETWVDNIQLSATSSLANPDADDDGIADAWEALYFTTNDAIDGSLDSDGDGVTDFFEYLYGSVPTDAASGGFHLGVGKLVGTGIVFDWEIQEGFVFGQDYDVAVSTDLSRWDSLPVEHFTLEASTSGGRTQFELEITHDYGTKVFLRLVSP